MKNKKNNIKEGASNDICINDGCDLVTTKRGFSLVEVLFSLLVLTLGIAGVLTLMTGNIGNAVDAKNQVIASQLAQEGYEVVRNLRDNTRLEPLILDANKLSSTGDCVSDGQFYAVDPFATMVCSWPGGYSGYGAFATKALYVDGATACAQPLTGLYSYATTCPSGAARVKSKFYRVINMDKSAGQIAVKVYVTWNGVGFTGPSGGLDSFCTVANQCVSLISILPDSN